MMHLRYRLELRLQAPLLTRAVGALAFGVDLAMQRHHGRPAIGGSLVRGNIRHALDRFARTLAGDDPATAARLRRNIRRWMGRERTEDEWDPGPGRLTFDFFWYPESLPDDPRQPERHRIRIGDAGAVENGALLVVDSPFAVGEEPVFAGHLEARLDDEEEAHELERWLGKALDYIAAIGAQKGSGMGRLLEARLARVTPVLRVVRRRPRPASHERIGIALELDRPFLIQAFGQPLGNLYQGGETIPGSVLKGVIAAAHDNDADLLERRYCLDDLVVTAARPAPRHAPERAAPQPLSLALAGDAPLDLAQQAAPCLVRDREGPWVAPLFAPDWKARQRQVAAGAWLGHAPPEIGRVSTVRTAIDAGGNVAAQSALFALQAVDPAGYRWCADIDLRGIAAERRPGVVENLLELFAEGLHGIGKTRARARVEVLERPFLACEPPSRIEPEGGDPYLVLLCSPARLLPDNLQLRGTNGDGELKEMYADYWSKAADGLLELSHCFARAERVGGELYWRRFRGGPATPYRPEWLTVAGSVFALCPTKQGRMQPDELQRKLEEWHYGGLPQAADRHGETWASDPFIRHNGFGEVRIDHPRQLKLCADARERCHVLD